MVIAVLFMNRVGDRPSSEQDSSVHESSECDNRDNTKHDTSKHESGTSEQDPDLQPSEAKRPSRNNMILLDMILAILSASEIEGTLKILRELYTEETNIDALNVPNPVIDDKPSNEDMKFMEQACEVATESPDDNTKVICCIEILSAPSLALP